MTKSTDFLELIDPKSSALDDFLELDSQSLPVPTLDPPEHKDDLEDTIIPSLALFKPMERKVIELASRSNSLGDISLKLALPLSTVEAILCRKDVQEHLVMLSDAMNQVSMMRLKGILQESIESRIEGTDDMADISRKDTLELIKAYADIITSERKLKAPEKEQNIYLNILQSVTKD